MATYPNTADVRLGVEYGPNDNDYTGILDLPSVTDVRYPIVYDNENKQGELIVPADTDVRLGVGTGTLDLPAVADVRDGTKFDGEAQEGELIVPAATDVRFDVPVDAALGLLDLPSVTDVRDGTKFDGEMVEGSCAVPAATDVRLDVSVDNTLGTCRVPEPKDVRWGFMYDAADYLTGDHLMPEDYNVRAGVTYGGLIEGNREWVGTMVAGLPACPIGSSVVIGMMR